MDKHRPLWLLVNGSSGSHQQDRIDALCKRLSEAGHAPQRVLECKADGIPDANCLREAGVGTLAVHGGDGTINGAVAALEGWRGELLPLPGGTANLLCNRLYRDADLLAIIDRFTAGALVPQRIGCVTCDEGFALSELLIGPGARWADVREDLREGDLSGLVRDALDAASRSVTGPMVRMTHPAIGRKEGYSGIRLVPGTRDFAIEGYGPETIADYIAQGAALLRRDFRDGPHEELGCVQGLHCRTDPGEGIALMIDGERAMGESEMVFGHRLLDLQILGLRDEASGPITN